MSMTSFYVHKYPLLLSYTLSLFCASLLPHDQALVEFDIKFLFPSYNVHQLRQKTRRWCAKLWLQCSPNEISCKAPSITKCKMFHIIKRDRYWFWQNAWSLDKYKTQQRSPADGVGVFPIRLEKLIRSYPLIEGSSTIFSLAEWPYHRMLSSYHPRYWNYEYQMHQKNLALLHSAGGVGKSFIS